MIDCIVSRVANHAMVEAYWRVGRLMVEAEQKGRRRVEYSKAVQSYERFRGLGARIAELGQQSGLRPEPRCDATGVVATASHGIAYAEGARGKPPPG